MYGSVQYNGRLPHSFPGMLVHLHLLRTNV